MANEDSTNVAQTYRQFFSSNLKTHPPLPQIPFKNEYSFIISVDFLIALTSTSGSPFPSKIERDRIPTDPFP